MTGKHDLALVELDKMKSRNVLLGACKSCPVLESNLDAAKVSLEDLKSARALLSTCDVCPSLQCKFNEARARIREIEKLSIPSCGTCQERAGELNELRTIEVATEDENTYLSKLSSWVSTKEPQIGMLLQNYKRTDDFGVALIVSLWTQR